MKGEGGKKRADKRRGEQRWEGDGGLRKDYGTVRRRAKMKEWLGKGESFDGNCN